MALHLLELLRAGLRQQELAPSVRPFPTLRQSAMPQTIRAAYICGDKRLGSHRARATGSPCMWRGQEVALERRGEDELLRSLTLTWSSFHLEFGRDEGRVVEVFHGPDWYVGEGYSGPGTFDYPEEWERYLGHYRTYNFGLTNFRIVLRKGALLLMYPRAATKS